MEMCANFRLFYSLLPDVCVIVFMGLGSTFKFQNGVNRLNRSPKATKCFFFFLLRLLFFTLFILSCREGLGVSAKLRPSTSDSDSLQLQQLMEAEPVCSLLSHKMAFFIECNERNSLTALLVRL